MSGPELDYKKRVRDALVAMGWHMQFHEDRIEKYIPDCSWGANFVEGWFEVKYCARAPKNLAALEHWTKGQEEWLMKRGAVGNGHCYLLLGTPTMNVLWSWNCLKNIRSMPFNSALRFSMVRARAFGEFIYLLDRRCRIR